MVRFYDKFGIECTIQQKEERVFEMKKRRVRVLIASIVAYDGGSMFLRCNCSTYFSCFLTRE